MNFSTLIFLAIIALAIYYFYQNGNLTTGCSWCPKWGSCPTCPTSQVDAQQVLDLFVKGCLLRLRGVMRDSSIDLNAVQEFMTTGTNRLLIVTDIIPEDFVTAVQSGNVSAVKATALVSTVQNNEKMFMVMKVSNGQMGPIGSPTSDFAMAYSYLGTVAKEIGPDNLVFFIDEDIPCGEDGLTDLTETDTTPVLPDTNAPMVENCCGKND